MKIAIRVSYPELGNYNWHEALSEFQSVGQVEVAFFDYELFPAVSLESVQRPFEGGLKLEVGSVHAPHVRVTRLGLFEKTIEQACRYAKALGAKYIVVHPTNAKLEEVVAFLNHTIVPILEEYDCVLCWETFLGGRRLFSGPQSIARFCENRPIFGMCYDTSHLIQGTLPILEDFYKYQDAIKVFHISNWSRMGGVHLPLRHKDGVIDFRLLLEKLSQDFDGIATLEYLPSYHHLLVQDAKWAMEFCY